MKISAETSELFTALEIAEKALPLRATVPIISNIFLEIRPGELIFTATDHEIFIKTGFKHETEQTVKVLLPPKIIDIIRHLPEERTEIEINTDNYRLDLRSGPAHFNLYGSAGDDFPASVFLEGEEDLKTASIELQKLKKILREVIFAASVEETRPAFNGVLFAFSKNELALTASDTYRLVVNTVKDETWSFADRKCLVPAKALRELLKIMGDGQTEAEIGFKDTYFSISYDNVFFASRLLGEKYPDVSGVIPENYLTNVSVDRKSLESAVSRASLLAEGKNQAVNIAFKEDMFKVKVSGQEGSMEEVVEAECKGEEVDLFVNSRFVLDILKIMDSEKVIIDFHGDRGPIIFRLPATGDYLYLVLPIKKAN